MHWSLETVSSMGLKDAFRRTLRRDGLVVAVFMLLTAALALAPTGFEGAVSGNTLCAEGTVLAVDDSEVGVLGLVRQGDQSVTLEIRDGPFAGQVMVGNNPLLGMMDRDKLFKPGDAALVVLTLDKDGRVLYVNPQEHYRLGLELLLLGLFAALLLAFGGWTGAKALFSFLFAAMAIWKVLVPLLLKGHDPVWVALGVVASLTAAVIFLVAGPTRKGLAAFLGAFAGVLSSCFLALVFTKAFHVHGAILPFAETLLYSGYAHLNLTRIFVAAVFLAASGAVMDLGMDVAASLDELAAKNPGMGRWELFTSGLRVGRAVVGTMTTTLLLAYSGGFITLLMAFMAQGIPLANTFNLIYVAAEVLKTLVGSFGLVLVGPLTALFGALIYGRGPRGS